MKVFFFSFLFFSFLFFICAEDGTPLPGSIPDSINKVSSNELTSENKSKEKKEIKTTAEEEKVGVVASVNGEPVTVLDILEVCGIEESRLPYVYKGAQLQEEIRKLRIKALEDVIDRKLIYQEFKENGYELPKRLVEDNFDKLMHSFNVNNRQEFEKKLVAGGITLEEFQQRAYENFAVELLVNERCFADAFVTPKTVYDYYVEHKDDYTTPRELKLQIMKLNKTGVHKDELDNLAVHLKKVLDTNSKNEFDDAVLLYSEGPNIERGGDIGWVDKSKLRKDFIEYVESADVNQVVGPIKSKEAYYFLRIADVKEEKTESFKVVQKKIKEKLLLDQKEKNYKKYVENLRSKALINKYL